MPDAPPDVRGPDLRESAAPRLVLASASPTRRRLLEQAGVPVEVIPAEIDEAAVREALTADNPDIDPADIAEVLARVKAEAVSAMDPDAIVIAADQVLALGSEILSKPADMVAARSQLLKLQGETHELFSAVAIATGGAADWAIVESARLTMRPLSPQFIGAYLAAEGDAALGSVGAYRIEGPGIHLFARVSGDHFTILGLPLLPLLAELRSRKVIRT